MPENAKDELAWSPKTNGFEHHILRGNSHTKRAPVFHVPSRCQYLLLPWRSTIGRIFPRWSMLSAILAGSVPMIVGLKSPLPITSHHFSKVADSYHLRIIFEWTRRLSETSVATKPDTWRFFQGLRKTLFDWCPSKSWVTVRYLRSIIQTNHRKKLHESSSGSESSHFGNWF